MTWWMWIVAILVAIGTIGVLVDDGSDPEDAQEYDDDDDWD
jgi:hypothetical protein